MYTYLTTPFGIAAANTEEKRIQILMSLTVRFNFTLILRTVEKEGRKDELATMTCSRLNFLFLIPVWLAATRCTAWMRCCGVSQRAEA
jgi:hypothetical protein